MKKIILMLSVIVLTVSCNSYKQCHTKKYYVDKSVRKAQLKPRS